MKRLSFSYNIHDKLIYVGLVLTSVIITFFLDITRPETGFLEHIIFPLEWTIKIINSPGPRRLIFGLVSRPIYLTASDGDKQENKASHHYPVEKYRFWGIDGTVQQLPWTGLIQWGNDGTYILSRRFAIFRNFLWNFAIFSLIWKKEDCLLYK